MAINFPLEIDSKWYGTSGRRNENRIRGPKSALTDFLATHGISAAQIRDDYNTRVSAAEAAAAAETPAESNEAAEQEAEEEEAERVAAEAAIERSKKRKRAQDEAIADIKTKKGKTKDKKKGKKKAGSDDEDDDDFEDFVGKKMYKKAVKLPGQLAHCEVCEKRFTVTPYSKGGPDGGLLCTPCGKDLSKDIKKEAKPKRAPGAGRKRRKVESDRLDGRITLGAKSLQQLCTEKVVNHHEDVEEFGDMPANVMERLSEIFTKKRVMKPNTLKLFLRPELHEVVIHDCAYLESQDFQQIFAVTPNIEKLSLGNACQFKNDAMDYMIEKAKGIKHLQLYATNLVSNEKWSALFKERGNTLETLKLQWLDAQFDDKQVEEIAKYCPNLTRLKLERCRRIGEEAIKSITQMTQLKHLSLQLSNQISNDTLHQLIVSLGPNLETLSLDGFRDADDTIMEAIKAHCTKLSKMRISDNDLITDAAYANLFTNWATPPLRYADFSITRDVDNMNPGGPEDAPIGLGSGGLKALMAHSGSKLEYLNIASCRHASYDALLAVFAGTHSTQYPALKEVDLSMVSAVDTVVLAGLFKSAPNLQKAIAFGCFSIEDVVVPRGVVVIGVPRAQDAIERFGGVGERQGDVNPDEAAGIMAALMEEELDEDGPSWKGEYVGAMRVAAAAG